MSLIFEKPGFNQKTVLTGKPGFQDSRFDFSRSSPPLDSEVYVWLDRVIFFLSR